MKKAIKFALWLVTLLLAFAATRLFKAITLAPAFLIIHAFISVVLLVVVLITTALSDANSMSKFDRRLNHIASRFILAFLINAFLSAVATLLVEVTFSVAYLLLTFGQSVSVIDYIKDIELNLKSKLPKLNKEKLMFWKKHNTDDPDADIAPGALDAEYSEEEPLDPEEDTPNNI